MIDRRHDRFTVGACVVLIGLVLLGCAIYLPAADAPFIFDSKVHIEQNGAIDDLGSGRWFEHGGRRWIPMLTFAVDRWLWGDNVFGFHLTSVAIHIGSALLLYAIVYLTWQSVDPDSTSAIYGAVLAAMLWFAHPLQTQAVIYTVQRMETLMAMFFLLSLFCLIMARRSAWSMAWLAASVAAAFASACSKEVAIAIPLTLFAYDYVFAERAVAATAPSERDQPGSGQRRWQQILQQRWLYYCALVAVLCWFAGPLRMYVDYLVAGDFTPSRWSGEVVEAATADSAELLQGKATLDVPGLTPLSYAYSQPGVILHYLRLALLPFGQSLDYAWPIATVTPQSIVAAAVIVTLGVAAVALTVLRQPIGFCMLAFFLILGPTSSFFPIRDLAYEHRMYLPLACVLVPLAVGLVMLARSRPLWGTGAATAMLMMLTVTAFARCQQYRTGVAIWSDVVRKAEDNPRGHVNLASHLIDERGDYETAITHNQLALKLLASPRQNFPLNVEPSVVHRNLSKAYNNHGLLLLRERRWSAAKASFAQAIEHWPTNAHAYSSLGNLCVYTGNYDAAITAFERALQHDPDLVAAAKNLAVAKRLKARQSETGPSAQQVSPQSPRVPRHRSHTTAISLGPS